MSPAAVGIDLGTTISVLARSSESGGVEFVRTRDGSDSLRSVVMVEDSGNVVVGDQAARAALLDPESCFALFKRSMGEESRFEAGGRAWTPVDLSAEVLKALVEDFAADTGETANAAVVTIPAYFGDDARRDTLSAIERAGLEPLTLLHEPTAACLAYDLRSSGDSTVLVYDLGGGTFDVSVVRFSGKAAQVLTTVGDHRLGGRDWDAVMAELIVEKLDAIGAEDPMDNPALLEDLLERAREVKHALSTLEIAKVQVRTAEGLERVEVRRSEFETRAESLFAQTHTVVEAAVADAGGRDSIDEVLLVGGSTRMPLCAEIVRDSTGLDPQAGVDPDKAVARGAALAAARHTAGEATRRPTAGLLTIRDATAHALGFVVVSADGSRYVNEVMIERTSPIPAARSKQLTLDLGRQVSPTLEVHMLQGEAERPLETQPLGSWTFENIDVSGSTSRVALQVSFEYDGDGVADVSAAVDGQLLPPPVIDRDDRDLRWTEEDPSTFKKDDITAALVIDTSGSMSGEKLTEAKRAIEGFIEVLDEAGVGNRIALITFDSSASRLSRVGDSPGSIAKALSRVGASGGTDMAAGLEMADDELPDDARRRVVILLTDGWPNDSQAALRERDCLVNRGVSVVARGVSGADEEFIRRLDTEGGRMVDLSDLVGAFRGIARQITRGGGNLAAYSP